MTEKDREESLIERAAEKLLVGTGPKAPFLIRHDRAIPVIVFGACGAFAILVMISIIQGWAQVLMWIVIGIGVVSVLPAIPGFVGMYRATRGPLPALDRTPRTARVTLNAEDADGGRTILVEYRDEGGSGHDAQLADLIHESWEGRFTPGTRWQVYTFRAPELADSVVFLTEAHDDVWRDGWKLDGVRIGGEGGPLKPGPGSSFLREDSKWRFES
ncbi:hypothetical protein ACFWZ7_03400 [Nocardiopsis alba]|uniref:hypothetical protein n=1 Tax=Nocardiopsis alba TaxID=53437 RepID=UPI00366FBDBD